MAPPVRRIIGIVVLLLGIVLVVIPLVVGIQSSGSLPPSSSNNGLIVEPTIQGSGTLTVSWTTADANAVVTLYSCSDSTCSQFTQIANATGSSGSVSASVTGGHFYGLTLSRNAGNLDITETVYGFGNLCIVGIIIAVVGAILVAIPARRRASSEAPMPEAPAAAPEEPAVAPPEETVYGAEPAAPVVQDHDAEIRQSTAVPVGGSGKMAVKCPNCGTMNEPWITNCRWCKRPLSSTG